MCMQEGDTVHRSGRKAKTIPCELLGHSSQDTFDHDKRQKSAISGRCLHRNGFYFSPLDVFPFLEVFCVIRCRNRPKMLEKIARFPGEKKTAESCHVSGCHGFLGPELPHRILVTWICVKIHHQLHQLIAGEFISAIVWKIDRLVLSFTEKIAPQSTPKHLGQFVGVKPNFAWVIQQNSYGANSLVLKGPMALSTASAHCLVSCCWVSHLRLFGLHAIELVIFFSLTEAPLPDTPPRPHPTPRNGPETEAETEPNGAEMDRNQALWGGTAGGGFWDGRGWGL